MRDQYDLMHEETGSGNISQATPEWKEVLAQARAMELQDGEYVLHKAYGIVNQRVAAGERWNKCMECGSPYIVSEHTTAEFCSNTHGESYTKSFSKGL